MKSSTHDDPKEGKMKLQLKVARMAVIALPLMWAATASADFVEKVPVSKGQYYQTPTKAGTEKGIYSWMGHLNVETSDGSLADDNCHVSALGTALFDGTTLCAWGNIQVVGTGALCPALPEGALVDFSGPYTVNPDGSISADLLALGGLAPVKLGFNLGLDKSTAVFSCEDVSTAPADKSWVVCSGVATKINKAPKIVLSGGTCSKNPATTCKTDGDCQLAGAGTCKGTKVPLTCANSPQ